MSMTGRAILSIHAARVEIALQAKGGHSVCPQCLTVCLGLRPRRHDASPRHSPTAWQYRARVKLASEGPLW